MGGDVGEKPLFGCLGHVVAEGLGKELVGGGEVLFTMAEEDACSSVEARSCRFADQRGLSEARLTRDEKDLAAPARGHAFECTGDRRQLDLPANHAGGRARDEAPGEGNGPGPGIPERLPEHFNGCHRIGQALQGEVPQRPALVSTAATGHQPHDVCGKDLSAVAQGTESGRFDNRVPEIIVVFLGDLPATQPHAQADRLSAGSVGLFDALLHRHRAPECRGRRREDHHEAVSEVLHLRAIGLGDRLAQDGKVAPTNLVSHFGGQALGQFRRADDVGEQDRHVLRGQWSTALP